MINAFQNFIVLDDDPVNNMICAKIIKNVFPQAFVITFSDPDIAISYIESIYEKVTIPDTVLLLDINMPVLNGWDFLDAFDIKIKTHLRIYMLTCSFDPRDKMRATEDINVLGFFEKPLTRDKVESIEIVVHDGITTIAE